MTWDFVDAVLLSSGHAAVSSAFRVGCARMEWWPKVDAPAKRQNIPTLLFYSHFFKQKMPLICGCGTSILKLHAVQNGHCQSGCVVSKQTLRRISLQVWFPEFHVDM